MTNCGLKRRTSYYYKRLDTNRAVAEAALREDPDASITGLLDVIAKALAEAKKLTGEEGTSGQGAGAGDATRAGVAGGRAGGQGAAAKTVTKDAKKLLRVWFTEFLGRATDDEALYLADYGQTLFTSFWEKLLDEVRAPAQLFMPAWRKRKAAADALYAHPSWPLSVNEAWQKRLEAVEAAFRYEVLVGLLGLHSLRGHRRETVLGMLGVKEKPHSRRSIVRERLVEQVGKGLPKGMYSWALVENFLDLMLPEEEDDPPPGQY